MLLCTNLESYLNAHFADGSRTPSVLFSPYCLLHCHHLGVIQNLPSPWCSLEAEDPGERLSSPGDLCVRLVIVSVSILHCVLIFRGYFG